MAELKESKLEKALFKILDAIIGNTERDERIDALSQKVEEQQELIEAQRKVWEIENAERIAQGKRIEALEQRTNGVCRAQTYLFEDVNKLISRIEDLEHFKYAHAFSPKPEISLPAPPAPEPERTCETCGNSQYMGENSRYFDDIKCVPGLARDCLPGYSHWIPKSAFEQCHEKDCGIKLSCDGNLLTCTLKGKPASGGALTDFLIKQAEVEADEEAKKPEPPCLACYDTPNHPLWEPVIRPERKEPK